MQLYQMQVAKTQIYRTAPTRIPRGIIGAAVELSFSPEWENLKKTVIFRAGEITKDIVGVDNTAVIPAECTAEAGVLLEIGVYGVDGENTVAIPTLWAAIGRVTEAADPSGDETTDPTLPVYAQLQAQIDQLERQGITQNEIDEAIRDFFGGERPVGRTTPQGGEIFNFYTDPVYTGDGKLYPGNTASKGSHAKNFGTHADGEYSSASGWVSTASGGISDAGGRETEASGYCTVSRGWGTKASGSCADAGGRSTEATGANSFSRGLKAKATNSSSVAMGEETESSGYCADAGGFKTKAKGTTAFTRGRETEAREYASSAIGRGTIAAARNQHAQGAWNVVDVPDAGGNGIYAHIVGGGTSDTNRKNIYTLDWQGNAKFAGKVYSGGVELAPGGFGLGSKTGFMGKVTKEQLEKTFTAGWYEYYGEGGTDYCCDGHYATRYGGILVVPSMYGCNQFFFCRVHYGCYLKRHYTSSGDADSVSGHVAGWSPWEWVNPPMIPGEEYRTTERYNGKAVYAAYIMYACSAAVGNESGASSLNIPTGLSNGRLVRIHGTVNEKNWLPVMADNGGTVMISTLWDSGEVTLLFNNASFPAGTGFYFTIYYTKD